MLRYVLGGVGIVVVLAAGCGEDDCTKTLTCDTATTSTGGSGTTSQGGESSVGGSGGMPTGGGGVGGTGGNGGNGGMGGDMPPPYGFAQIRTAWGVTCAAMTDGFTRCWGDNQWGGVGIGSTTGTFDTPQDVDLTGVVQVTGSDRACARNASAVHCWGFGFNSSPTSQGFPGARWVSSSFLKASFELEHTCVADNGGDVHCWGDNNNGQLGIPSSTSSSNTPVMVNGVSNVDEVTAGIGSTCARSGNSVWCWGGIAGATHVPTTVNGLNAPTELDMTGGEACVIDEGAVKCWDDVSVAPTTVMIDAIDVASGWDHACAVDTIGEVYCWGNNDDGQLGNMSTVASSTPVKVTNLDDVKAISVGRGTSCAVKNDSTGWCWGSNVVGQLGNGGTTTPQTVPSQVVLIP